MTLRWLELRDPEGAAEIFTPPQLVREMLDQLPADQWCPGKTFLEPSCGNGNFLVEVVAYKLRGGCTPLEAVKDIYAVELMADGVFVSRYRTLKAAGLLRNTEAEAIVEKQIRQGDTLADPLGDDNYWGTPQPISFEDLKDTIEANVPYLREMGVPPFEVIRTNPKRGHDPLRNLFDALQPGNRLIICVPDGGHLESTALPFQQYIPTNDGEAKHIHHIYAWTAADLHNTLVEQGWDGIDIGFSNVNGFGCLWALAIKK